jgi:hypothetical protein
MTITDSRIPTRISPDLLDTIGRQFGFKHGKGIAEWLKNSLDNYLRLRDQGAESLSGGWPVYLCLIDGRGRATGPNLAVVDFGGASFSDVETFFLHWGDRSAAILGGAAAGVAVTGGHGNGGKFYMREMWRGGARFLTWKSGKATSLVVDYADVVRQRRDGMTGSWEIKDQPMGWEDALEAALPESDDLGGAAMLIAHLEETAPRLVAELNAGVRGLTVVVGRAAKQLRSANDVVRGSGRWNHQKLVDEILEAPQARRPIRELSISVFVNGELKLARLEPRTIEEDPDWPSVELSVPAEAVPGSAEAGESIGTLKVRKAAEQLIAGRKDENALYINDRLGNPIASYPVRELPLPGHSPVATFLQGELQLTFPDVEALVNNDRERLIASPQTTAILAWVGERIWERAKAIEAADAAQERNAELAEAAELNQDLNQHAQRFLEQLQTEMLVDFIDDAGGGGPGRSGRGTGGTGTGHGGDSRREDGRGGGTGDGGTKEIPGSTETVRRPSFPRVLLSGHDPDPARTDGLSKSLTEQTTPTRADAVRRAPQSTDRLIPCKPLLAW